jgi:5'-3' exonuclease
MMGDAADNIPGLPGVGKNSKKILSWIRINGKPPSKRTNSKVP